VTTDDYAKAKLRRLPLLSPGRRADHLRAGISNHVGEFALLPASRHAEVDVFRIEGDRGVGLLAERRGRPGSATPGHVSAWIAGRGLAGTLALEAELVPGDGHWTETYLPPGALPGLLAGIDPESVRLIAAVHAHELLDESDRERAKSDGELSKALDRLRRRKSKSGWVEILERHLAYRRRARIDPEWAIRQATAIEERERAIELQRERSEAARLQRVVADVVALFDSPHGSRVILGGDLLA